MRLKYAVWGSWLQEEQARTAEHLEALRLRTAEHQEACALARREARRSKRCMKALEARTAGQSLDLQAAKAVTEAWMMQGRFEP